MTQKLIIKEKFPSLNEYVNACRKNPMAGNTMKQNWQKVIDYYIRTAKLKPCKSKVDIDFVWQEKDKRRDPDNIAFAKKFILDALVDNGVLENDGQNQIGDFTDKVVKGESYAVMVLLKERKEV